MSYHRLQAGSGVTLFIDRDGVINRRIEGGYVRSWKEFEFLPGVLSALKDLSGRFVKIIVVSNQQGIGKGLMTEEDLSKVHERMIREIGAAGGRIDRVYHCPALESEGSFLRKPNVGMALRARKDFPSISFKRSVMVGDSLSDMLFGRRLKMFTVLLASDPAMIRSGHGLVDRVFPDLAAFAGSLGPAGDPAKPTTP